MAGDKSQDAAQQPGGAQSASGSPIVLSIRRPAAAGSAPEATRTSVGVKFKLKAPARPPTAASNAAATSGAGSSTPATASSVGSPAASTSGTKKSRSRPRPSSKPAPIPSFKVPPIPVVRLSSNIPVVPPPVIAATSTEGEVKEKKKKSGPKAVRKPPVATNSLEEDPVIIDHLLRAKGKKPGVKDVDEALGEAPLEEHLILRVPKEIAGGLRERVRRREALEDVIVNFHEVRKGTFMVGNEKHAACLVDLPCIIESMKTIDGKQFYKVADISQMIVVDPSERVNKDYLWADGITPPMQNVRKRRFRKRISKKMIEDVEQEVERLLLGDAECEDVRFDLLENVADLEGVLEGVHERNAADREAEQEEQEEQEEQDQEDQDQEEVPEQEQDDDEVEAEEQNEEEEDEDDDNDWDLDAEIDDVLEEDEREIRMVEQEIADLERKLAEKEREAMRQVNAIMRKRFEDILNKLRGEMEKKRKQLEVLREEKEENEMEAQLNEEEQIMNEEE